MLAQKPIVESAPRATRAPGIAERLLVVFVIFINIFGTPATWFIINTGANSGAESDVLLTFGSLAAVLILSLGLIGNGDAIVRIVTAEPLMTLYFFIVFISPVWSPLRGESLAGAANMATMVLFGIILMVRFRPPEIFQMLAAACAIGITMSYIWVFALSTYGVSRGGSWDGLGVQKNALGLHTMLSIMAFILAARLFPRFRVPLYSLTLAATVLLIGSQSKTSLVASAVTTSSFVIYLVFRARKTLRGAVFLALTASSVFVILLVTANLEAFLGSLGRDVTFSGRIGLWQQVIAGIGRVPWLGYGYDGFWGGPLSDSHEIAAYRKFDWGPDHAHSAVLESALHVGIPATILFIIFMLRSLVRATNHVQLVRGPVGLFPLIYLTLLTILSMTESGIFTARFSVSLLVVAVAMAKCNVDDAKLLGVMRLDEERSLRKAGYEVSAIPTGRVPAISAS